MHFFLSRARILGREVIRVLRMEASARRTREADKRLVAADAERDDSIPAEFAAPGRLRSRTLPARVVPLRTPTEHREALLADIAALLRAAGIPLATFHAVRDAQPVIALRQQDWSHALRALSGDARPLLLGGARRTARSTHLHYSAAPTEREIRQWTRAFALDPAVTVEDDGIVARYAFESLVRLERWVPDREGLYRSEIHNIRVDRLRDEDFVLDPGTTDDLTLPDSPALALSAPHLMEITFPIDVVYTWVDGTDPAWLERKRRAVEEFTGETMTEAAADDLRFIDHDELRYSLRALERYAPWVRHVYVVTDRQRPSWLREDHPRLTVVDHRDIAPDSADLPTFNSHAIEANLHRIEGLSEHFLYFNDDVFLSSPVSPDLFFSANGIANMYLSRALVGPGEPVPGEPASDTAGKNARAMVAEVSGRRLSRKLFHAPFALQRSVSEEIEQRWPEAIALTRASTFRRTGDVTLSGALHMNYAFATARAVTRGLNYRYVNVGARDAEARLAGLEKDSDLLATFCLNEADPTLDAATVDRLVRDFLRRRFPDRSTFELPG